MRVQDLDRESVDHVLSTTRAVRKRLDLERPVPLNVIEECLDLALQAPTGFNLQDWRWLIVTDPEKRRSIAEVFRRTEEPFLDLMRQQIQEDDYPQQRVADSSWYLAEHLHEVPVHVIPCLESRLADTHALFASLGYEGDLWNMAASAMYGGIWPAAWSFMLALRSRGLGSSLTMIHLGADAEVAELLDIPDGISQCGLIPVAWFKGDDFTRGPRRPREDVTFYEQWGRSKPVD